jgi:OmpA-OmpF porin, OOP family
MQSDIHRYRLAHGKGAAMKPHLISVVAAAFVIWAVATGAPAQQQINSSQMATSLAGVSNTKLSLTGAEMRQAVLDNIRNYPGALPPHALAFPQLENLAQFVVEVDFDFNSAVIRPSSYRTIGAIADALHNPILLGYGFLVIGHTDSVGGRQYNVGLSQRRAEAIRDALIDPFNVNPAVLEAVGMGEEQLRDPKHPTSGVNRRVQLVNVGKKFCFGRSGEQFVCP